MTQVSPSIMFSIQSLKVAVEIKQFISHKQYDEVFAYSEEIISAIQRDSYSFSPTFLKEIITTLAKVPWPWWSCELGSHYQGQL